MADVNAVVLIGRLVRDAEVSYTNSGFAITKGAVAVEHFNKNKENEVSYLDFKIIGKMGEAIKSFLVKGKQVGIEGYLKQERWEKEGQKQSRVLVMVNNIELLGGGNGGNQNNGYNAGYDNNGYSYN